jgi:tetratricopeptide (TPR) repeat protein
VDLAQDGDAAVRGRALLELGEVLFVSGDLKQATEVFVEAREQLREGGDEGHSSHAEGNIGLCWAARNMPDRALKWFRRGLDLARKQSLPILEARWLTEIGKTALLNGDGPEADRYALAALAIARPREHWMTIFRAEWLRHRVVAADVGKEDAKTVDRSRLARLRKLLLHLADHKSEPEIRDYEALMKGDSRSAGKRRRR